MQCTISSKKHQKSTISRPKFWEMVMLSRKHVIQNVRYVTLEIRDLRLGMVLLGGA